MFLISKGEYEKQLENIKDNTEQVMELKFKQLLLEEQERFEKEKKALEAKRLRKIQIRRKLRGYYWKQLLPIICLNVSRRIFTKKKKQIMTLYSNILPQIHDISFSIVKNMIQKYCPDVWDQSSSYNIVADQNILFQYKEKPLQVKDLNANVEVFEKYCRKILTGLIEIC